MSATKSTDPPISVTLVTGSKELRTWFEADPADVHTLRGMMMLTARDEQGRVLDVTLETTGVVLHVD